MAVAAGVGAAALINDALIVVIAVTKGGKGRGSEEDDVHNGEGPASFEHGAGLARLPAPVGDGNVIWGVPYGARVRVGAVCICDSSHFIDTGNERTHEAKIDQRYEASVCR